jgi:hypothetical protein
LLVNFFSLLHNSPANNSAHLYPVEFCIQLSTYYPDKDYGGDHAYADMLEQARLADQLGYDAVSITEHLPRCILYLDMDQCRVGQYDGVLY